jgi:type II secretory pathway pseudopilin PulG
MKSTLRWVVTSMVGIFIFLGGIGWNSAVRAREERSDNKANIKVFNVKMDVLIEKNQELNKKIEQYMSNAQKDREKIQEMLMKAIRNKNNDKWNVSHARH